MILCKSHYLPGLSHLEISEVSSSFKHMNRLKLLNSFHGPQKKKKKSGLVVVVIFFFLRDAERNPAPVLFLFTSSFPFLSLHLSSRQSLSLLYFQNLPYYSHGVCLTLFTVLKFGILFS